MSGFRSSHYANGAGVSLFKNQPADAVRNALAFFIVEDFPPIFQQLGCGVPLPNSETTGRSTALRPMRALKNAASRVTARAHVVSTAGDRRQ
jgi:hypothetical protein